MSVLWQVEDFFRDRDNCLLLDVRTPLEYARGHIPGAVNFPLLENEERAEVGTLYKQLSKEAAFERGLELVGPKLADFVRRARLLAKGRKVVVYCWRGGQRSGSMAWLLEKAGLEVVSIKGGYKAYRHVVLAGLQTPSWTFLVLSGKTGSGKTEILHELKQLGAQVVDLEGLANHRGSAFGALGMGPQPSSEHFANLLYDELLKMDPSRPIWLENESHGIGRVYLPDGFWKAMLRAPKIVVEVPWSARIQRLVKNYGGYPEEQLERAFLKIAKRLGGMRLQLALKALKEGNHAVAAALALEYYDKAYGKGKIPNGVLKGKEKKFTFETAVSKEIAKKLYAAVER